MPAATAAIVRLVRETAVCCTAREAAVVILSVVAEFAAADQASLALVSEGQLETVAVFPSRAFEARSQFPIGFGVAGWVAAVGEAVEIADVRQDRRYVALPYPETRAFVSVPLSLPGGFPPDSSPTEYAGEDADAADEVTGVLSLAAWRPGAFPRGTGEALRPIAQVAAVMLRRAAWAEAQSERMHELQQQTGATLVEVLHDLKGPAQSVAGFLQIVGEEQVGPLNEQQRDFLRTAHQECERLIAVLVARMEGSGRPASSDTAPISPARLAADVIERGRGQALSRGVRLQLRTAPVLPEVRADGAALRAVLVNLLQNAMRFSAAGSRVSVSVSEAAGWVCFAVSDDGPGFAPADLEHAFERGYQGPRGREAGSAGLGLWSARQTVEQLGGSIWVSNRPHGGATVRFALPAAPLGG